MQGPESGFERAQRLRELQRRALAGANGRSVVAGSATIPQTLPNQILWGMQVNLTGALREIIGARNPDGTPGVDDGAVEALYDLARNELLRRGKKL